MNPAIIRAFNVYEKIFPSNRGADAREFRSEQKNRWLLLLGTLTQIRNGHSGESELFQDIYSLTELLKQYAENLASVHQDPGSEWIVRSSLPLIEDPNDQHELLGCDRDQLIGAIAFESIHALGKVPGLTSNLSAFNLLGTGFYASLQMEYAANKSALSAGSSEKVNTLSAKAENLLSSLQEHLVIYRDGTIANSEKHRADIEAFASERKKVLAELETSTGERVDAMLKARQELERIRQPVELWSAAAIRHRREFWIGLLSLLFVVAGAAYAVIEYINPALKNLDFVQDNAAQPFTPASTLTLAAMVALIAAAGFVLKIIGRFVTNSLTLSEDAQVRAALADTFIGLTAEETKATDEARNQARTVMLAALFRPLPGHQQEDITAPTVLSLAQDLLKKPG